MSHHLEKKDTMFSGSNMVPWHGLVRVSCADWFTSFQNINSLNLMLGKLLSTTIKVVTLPVDAASAAADIVSGGDGSKHSRTRSGEMLPNVPGAIEEMRDRVAQAAEDIAD